nr:hypothetical protein CFP56_14163 [Quercus suber]
MEETILNDLKHLKLTKEEGEEICITHINPVTNFEECSLSLFGKLLSDRQQNIRALKNTLRTAWKLGSDLRIVEATTDGRTDGVGNHVPSDTLSMPGSTSLGGNTFSEANQTLGNVPKASVAISQTTLLLQAGENLNPINEERASASRVGHSESLNSKTQEATSPLRPKLERKCKLDVHPMEHGPSNSGQTRKKVNLKKVARKKAQDDGQAQDTEMFTKVVEVGFKRPGNFEALEIEENRVQIVPFMLTPSPPLPLMVYRRWLPCNTARSNDHPRMELSGNWEPPDSSGAT